MGLIDLKRLFALLFVALLLFGCSTQEIKQKAGLSPVANVTIKSIEKRDRYYNGDTFEILEFNLTITNLKPEVLQGAASVVLVDQDGYEHSEGACSDGFAVILGIVPKIASGLSSGAKTDYTACFSADGVQSGQLFVHFRQDVTQSPFASVSTHFTLPSVEASTEGTGQDLDSASPLQSTYSISEEEFCQNLRLISRMAMLSDEFINEQKLQRPEASLCICKAGSVEGQNTKFLYCACSSRETYTKVLLSPDGTILGKERYHLTEAVFNTNGEVVECTVQHPTG